MAEVVRWIAHIRRRDSDFVGDWTAMTQLLRAMWPSYLNIP